MAFENQTDWPEKYDINKMITREQEIAKITEGEKVSVRRNDRYADQGDQVLLGGHLYTVTDVYPQQLKNMTEQEAKDEGFESLSAYQDLLTHIHGGEVWDPEQYVWAHYLEEK